MRTYRQRRPRKTPVYRIFSQAYIDFKAVYDQKYQKKYGFFRSVIEKEVEKYLRCGIFEYGFARVQCTNKNCHEEFLLPFSCRSRSLCSSCMTKHMLLFQIQIMETVAAKVPHRHMVFCLPKVLRGGFIKNRAALNDLSRMTWESIKEFYQKTLKSNGVPGGINIIQTNGNMINLNPHTHTIVSDGVFCGACPGLRPGDGTFLQMPVIDSRARACLQKIFEKKVIRFCLEHKESVSIMMRWRHTGFSVYTDSRMDLSFLDESLLAGKEVGFVNEEQHKIAQMLRYVSKPFFSQEKIVLKEGADRILYKGSWHHGIKRNFEYFTFTDFIAAVTAHVPNYRQKYINYYGWYSNKSRGRRNPKEPSESDVHDVPVQAPTADQKEYRKTWAILIRKVWEIDPLVCPKCSSPMHVISVIHDPAVIRKIVGHLGIWEGHTADIVLQDARGSPVREDPAENNGIEYEPFVEMP